MNVVLIKALQLLCCLSLLVLLHEAGHFGFAKMFHVRVEKFIMFFDPYFRIFSTRAKWFTRLFPYFRNNETEYGIGWIPLGGYVKIAGMVDESMDTEQMKKPAQKDEFRSQSVLKRFLILFGGLLMNLLTAWVLYSMVLFVWGRDYIPMRSIGDGFQYNEFAKELGFCDGDIPVAVDGKEIREYAVSIYRDISNAGTVTVLRSGEEVELAMPEEHINMLTMLQMSPAFMSPIAPSIVDSVMPGSAADEAGMEGGARLIAVGGKEIATWGDFDQALTVPRQYLLASEGCTHADSLAQRKVAAVYLNPGAEYPDTVEMTLDENYMMGVVRRMPQFDKAHQGYGIAECIPAGLVQGWKVLSGYVNDLKYVASSEGAKSVGSFITIGSIFPASWDWQQFWMLTAFISIILAVMNILPIPGLDGGHIAFLVYEGITGRQPSDKAMEWFEKIGLGILCLLMLLALSNDVRNFILPIFGL